MKQQEEIAMSLFSRALSEIQRQESRLMSIGVLLTDVNNTIIQQADSNLSVIASQGGER